MTSAYTPSNGLAVAAAWLGATATASALAVLLALNSPFGVMIAWLTSLVPGLLALIFGIIAVNTASKIGGRRRAPAIWGIVFGVSALPVALILRLGLTALIGI